MKIKRAIYRTLPVLGVCFFVSMPVIPCIYDRPEEPVEMFPAEWLEYKSGMPCEGIALDIEKQPISTSEISVVKYSTNVVEETKQAEFARIWASEEEYEQETGSTQAEHETGAGVQGEYSGVGERVQTAVPDETQVETDPESDRCEREPDETACGETDSEVVGDVGSSAEPSTGTEVQPTLCEVLLAELEQAGIGWWYPYASYYAYPLAVLEGAYLGLGVGLKLFVYVLDLACLDVELALKDLGGAKGAYVGLVTVNCCQIICSCILEELLSAQGVLGVGCSLCDHSSVTICVCVLFLCIVYA